MKKIIVAFALLSLVYNCKEAQEVQYASIEKMNIEIEHPGKKLMETNCYACHSPTANHDNRIAPPMIAVKKHYIREGITKTDFINDMQNWIKNPNKEDAKMYGAVRRFGVMPKQVFSEETIKQIGDYMFDNDIEQPEWFDEHFKEMKGKHGKM